MKTTKTTGILAATMVAAGVLIGGAAEFSSTRTQYLADYGSAITAENSEQQAESQGVRHMDDHEKSPRYFEQMNGAGE